MKNIRGFEMQHFSDDNGVNCSIQESSAVQKQIPMKCKKRYYDDEDEETGEKFKWEFDLCPVCENHIWLKEYIFCPYCGQALDRSET